MVSIPVQMFCSYIDDTTQIQGFGCTFSEGILCGDILAFKSDSSSNIYDCPIVFRYDPNVINPTVDNLFVSEFLQNQNGTYSANDPRIDRRNDLIYLDTERHIGWYTYVSSDGNSALWNNWLINVAIYCNLLAGENNYSSPSMLTLARVDSYLDSLPRDKKPFEREISVVGGGDGLLEETNDTNELGDIDIINNNSILRTWFVSQYQPNTQQLQDIAEVFWSDNFMTNLKKIFSDPMESIINLSLLPISPTVSTPHNVIIGSFDTGVAGVPTVYNQFVEFDCGNIDVQEFWGSALDYSPSTEIEIFLPFIGIEKIQTDDIMNSTINITYRIDTLTGTANAFLTRLKDEVKNILYQWQGNCSFTIPITGKNYSQFISGLIQATVTIGAGIASGGGAGMSLIGATSSLATNSKVHVNKSGNFVCASGFMGYRTPYLIINRPCQSLPNDYEKFHGFQSNVTEVLSELKGFTKVKEIKLEGVNATEEEYNEIMALLKDGVYL